MTLSQKQRIFTINVAKLIVEAYNRGIELTFGEVFRTTEQQLLYVQSGKSKTMNSNHLRRLAVDFNFFINGKLTYDWNDIKPLGEYWETLHPANRWGGDWNKNDIKDGFIDTPHFEMNA
ncbi:M15 family metallopeptidase [Zobellia galactanivorans]|uniref:M15 family metallopeptidase n=1 Tax=Zobellia galactanivorans (strain DSM 12802 / CCUG 47099 / CIP 106680 / NCIMB 13871 / Dsij) TaxID=63186 RepID=UPI0026E13D48|nr:M15 family metallopeptidase [Zobellia galactanivorans]MDO6808089.1 M15 family metallopeptidase [Zobellia galactanivorans]